MSLLLYHLLAGLAAGRDRFVSLELSFSADSATVPSRSLLTYIRMGIPEQRFGLMLDVNETQIHVDTCLRDKSRTFNVVGDAPSDLIVLEEEELMNPELRGYFRLPVNEHCGTPHNMSERYYGNCLSEKCNGIIGISPLSSLWEIPLGAFSLSLESLHLGRTNPFFHQPPSSRHTDTDDEDNTEDDFDNDDHVVVDCRERAPSGICEFEARIGGIDVIVDFHTHDSYIYVPHRIYSLYMSSISLENVHGARKIDFSSVESSRRGAHTKRDKLEIEPPQQQCDEFHAHLEHSREEIADRSVYYRNSLHRFTMSQWLPLVIELRSGSGALVIDSDLLIHSPSYANSYAGVERSASEHFFGELASLQQTILLKPHPTEPNSNRVSIGNGVLRRYTLHVDRLKHRMLIEERVIVEHLTTLEMLATTLLFTFFVRSVLYSAEHLAPLSLCVGCRCPGCEIEESDTKRHKRVSSHSLREALFFLLVIIVPPIVLARLPVFVPHSARYRWFYIWAWTTLAVNGAILLANLWYSALVARGNRPASGTYCWRSFRIVLSRSSSSENLALLGMFCLAVILRREGLSTPVGAVIGALTIANGVRHLYQVYRFNLSVYAAREELRKADVYRPIQLDPPRRSANTMWGAYVIFVLAVLNTILAALFFGAEVFYLVTKFSTLSSILIVALSICGGVWIVNQYADAEMRKS